MKIENQKQTNKQTEPKGQGDLKKKKEKSNILLSRVSEWEEKEGRTEKVLGEIIAENFLYV